MRNAYCMPAVAKDNKIQACRRDTIFRYFILELILEFVEFKFFLELLILVVDFIYHYIVNLVYTVIVYASTNNIS